ncbi:MAG: serine--tRNA ligase [Alphaproteobacteria bacterium]
MFDISFIREFPEKLDQGLKCRGLNPLSAQILKLDEEYRNNLTNLENLRAERKRQSKEFSKLNNSDTFLDSLKNMKEEISALEEKTKTLHEELTSILSTIPNIPHETCPYGVSENDNKELLKWGKQTEFSFIPKSHDELGTTLGLMDFDRATKLSGSRFVVLYKDLARLERALSNFMLDIHTKEWGFLEVSPPILMNEKTMYGAGQLPKFKEDLFKTTNNYWLIPTAEVVLTNLVAGEILDEKQLPLRFTAYTQCFRSEAGAAGKDTRGMIRQHQFGKVELVSITKPECGIDELDYITNAAQSILKYLELPYRIVELCTGDLGFSSVKTFDIEVWVPSQKKYREISSCSLCDSFQARRMKARYRDADKKPQYVSTLNASGLAVGRTIVAILENYQNNDGTITVPNVLRSYMDGQERISPYLTNNIDNLYQK